MGKEWDDLGGRRGNPLDSRGGGINYKALKGHTAPKNLGARMSIPKCANCGKWQYNGHKPSQCSCGEPVWVQKTSLVFPHKMQEWHRRWGVEAYRVTKPGGYLLAFGGTRTHHRLVCGLEDAGWIIRDELDWIYASGFPKGKANLKPAHEPIVLARKPGPLRPLNIEETRIGTAVETWPTSRGYSRHDTGNPIKVAAQSTGPPPQGRWPSNLFLSDPALFDEPNPWVVGSGATATSGGRTFEAGDIPAGQFFREMEGRGDAPFVRSTPYDRSPDSGGYSRFFIIPKSARADREPVLATGLNVGAPLTRTNTHPTCKPTDLMRHLIRLVTPPGGTVLDCFAGSGSTLVAAELEGYPWIAIEQSEEYVRIIEARLNGTQRGLGLAG